MISNYHEEIYTYHKDVFKNSNKVESVEVE